MDLELPEDGDFDTIGGLVFSELGRVPQAGEVDRLAGQGADQRAGSNPPPDRPRARSSGWRTGSAKARSTLRR